MALYPFTPEGVENKLSALYFLSNELLNIEANSIEVGFIEWMENNFDLNTSQKTFLNNIAEEVINYYGSQTALCFRHRLDIILIYPTPLPMYAKLVKTNNTIEVIADDDGNIEVTGSLTFTMIYR